jgi:hypothetical protein
MKFIFPTEEVTMTRRTIRSRSSSAQGFTRIDLIACITVTLMLMALVASGLSSSKDNVSRMVCGSNMRQLALAVGMYACDNQDYLAFCNWDGGEGPDPSPGWLYTVPVPPTLTGGGQNQVPDPFKAPWNTNGATALSSLPASAWESGVYFPYMKSPQAYLCPTDIQSPDWAMEPTQNSGGPGRNDKLSSYVMDGASCNFGGQPSTSKVSDVWNPDCYLLWDPDENSLGPNNPGAFEYNDGANFPTVPPEGGEGLAMLHGNNGGEIVTVGGNVNFVTRSTFQSQARYQGAGPYGRGLAWWAPNLPYGGWGAGDE